MSQCTSQAGLHRKMAGVYDFCKGTAFEGREYLCVKADGTHYEFALGIVEDKLVWEGDKLYHAVMSSQLPAEFYEDAVVMHNALEVPSAWSWNPPTPPKPKRDAFGLFVRNLLEGKL